MLANIVFMDGSEAEAPLAILDNDGVDAAIAYLAQWDQGEGHEVRDFFSEGTEDSVATVGDYVLTFNLRRGYIGLERILPPGQTADKIIA